MCGILLVKSTSDIPLSQHFQALKKIESRGPDLTRWKYQNNIFIAQSVLHITGSDTYYQQTHKNFLAYNGEIYNYRWQGYYNNDIELLHDLVPARINELKQCEGMWAWAWTDFNQILYASDPQGEKCLYRYQDSDILIVSSEISAILEYRKLSLDIKDYTTKHWPVISSTPWQGIDRVPPGVAFNAVGIGKKIDSVFDWRQDTSYQNIDEAYEEFSSVFQRVMQDMIPTEPYGICFSAGVDTSCILAQLPNVQHLYSVNSIGKDTVSIHADKFLSIEQQTKLITIDLDAQQWAEFFKQVIDRTCMPVQSWSFVGQWVIASQCQERVLFGGVGADELFGGYDIYRTLEYTDEHCTSPYSWSVDDAEMQCLWNQCMDFYHDPRPATLLMDYLIQCSAVDLRGVDITTQSFGIEPRSPFTHPAMIKFALNLPYEYRQGKPLLKRLFLETWSKDLLLPKQGFSGHCNDSYPYLGIDIPRSNDRMLDWKNINREVFTSRWTNSKLI